VPDGVLCLKDIFYRNHGPYFIQRMDHQLAVGDSTLIVRTGIVKFDGYRESVEFRIRKRERPGVPPRIPRGNDYEWLRHRMANAVHRDLMFIETFEERRLSPWGRTVNFVYKNDLGQNRSRAKVKIPVSLVEHIGSSDIGREKVCRALDTLETGINRLGEALRQNRFADARRSFHHDVATSQQAHHHQPDSWFIANQHAVDIVDHFAGDLIRTPEVCLHSPSPLPDSSVPYANTTPMREWAAPVARADSVEL
jgi:hypothetical protein